MKKKYKHIFFDLDRTLWDFEKNSMEALSNLFDDYQLKERNIPLAEEFIKVYKRINSQLWVEYRDGKITKDELRKRRFHEAFLNYQLDEPDTALEFNDRYIEICTQKTHLIPGAVEVLEYLNNKYHLHIITNGFLETQEVKLEKTGIKDYFKAIIISDGLGYLKPDKRIFDYALKQAEAEIEDSVMIGDDYESDILGAKEIGMDQVYLQVEENDSRTATYKIADLQELIGIL